MKTRCGRFSRTSWRCTTATRCGACWGIPPSGRKDWTTGWGVLKCRRWWREENKINCYLSQPGNATRRESPGRSWSAFEKCGHVPAIEKTEEFVTAVVAFLGSGATAAH